MALAVFDIILAEQEAITLSDSDRVALAGGAKTLKKISRQRDFRIWTERTVDEVFAPVATNDELIRTAVTGVGVTLGDLRAVADVRCTTGDHPDEPAAGDAWGGDETQPDQRVPYCAECLTTLGDDYDARWWSADNADSVKPSIRDGLIDLWFECRPDRERNPETLVVASGWADDVITSKWEDEPAALPEVVRVCIREGLHLTSADDEGYCNYCGQPDAPIIDTDESERT